MSKMTYGEQLRHPNWQRRRLEIMKRDEFVCQSCFASDAPLHVHHKHYTKGRMVWEYTDDELVTLCEECHAQAHDEKEALKVVLSRLRVAGPFNQSEAIAMIAGWAAAGLGSGDLAEFRDLAPYAYDAGRAAAALFEIPYTLSAEKMAALANAAESAGPEQSAAAIEAFAKALGVR